MIATAIFGGIAIACRKFDEPSTKAATFAPSPAAESHEAYRAM